MFIEQGQKWHYGAKSSKGKEIKHLWNNIFLVETAVAKEFFAVLFRFFIWVTRADTPFIWHFHEINWVALTGSLQSSSARKTTSNREECNYGLWEIKTYVT